MKQLSKYIATAVIGIFIGLLIFKTFDCNDRSASQIKKDIEAVQNAVSELQDSVKASEERAQAYYDSMMYYAKQRPLIKEYYNYVYNQVDSIVDRDSNDVYRLIRAYTDSLRPTE